MHHANSETWWWHKHDVGILYLLGGGKLARPKCQSRKKIHQKQRLQHTRWRCSSQQKNETSKHIHVLKRQSESPNLNLSRTLQACFHYQSFSVILPDPLDTCVSPLHRTGLTWLFLRPVQKPTEDLNHHQHGSCEGSGSVPLQ